LTSVTAPSATLPQDARPDEPTPPIALEVREDEVPDTRRKRLVLVLACVAAFVVGFAGVTAIMRGAGSASKSPPKTKAPAITAAAPAAPPSSAATAERPAAAPTPPAPVPEVDGGPAAAPQSPSAPAPRQEQEGASQPTPTTSVPPTNPPTTTPSTTTP
jgi:hypothetical protein